MELEEGREGGDLGGGDDELPTEAIAEQDATWSPGGDDVVENLRWPSELDAVGGGGTTGIAVAGSGICLNCCNEVGVSLESLGRCKPELKKGDPTMKRLD